MMFRLPRVGGALTYAAAWLKPWSPIFRARARDSGLTFLVHRRDVVGRHIAKYGSYEPEITKWIAQHLENSPPGIVIDAGANVGWHSIHAARKKTVEAVVSFEPDPFNAWLFNDNVTHNRAENIIFCGHALGARPGIAKLYRYKNSNLGRHSLASDHGMGSSSVTVRDLDSVLNDLGLSDRRIILIKIDVEGYEPAVLDGACQALTRTDAIVAEYSPALSRKGGLSTDCMVDNLLSRGFQPSSITGEKIEWSDLTMLDGQIDVVWQRQTARGVGIGRGCAAR